MYYIVGLGNPGEKYTNTRHNVGFVMLEQMVGILAFPSLHDSSAYSGRMSTGSIDGEEVTVLLPTTFMNASGSAVKKLLPKGEEERLAVVYDDVDLPLGQIKVSFGRGDGGHNGVKSIIESIGTREFVRIRIGVARTSFWSKKPVRPKGEKLASYVLQPFSKKELQELATVQETFNKVVHVLVTQGRAAAMNQFN